MNWSLRGFVWFENILLKISVFWDVAPCSLIEIDRLFRGAYCFHHQGDRPVSTCVTSVKDDTTRRITEDSGPENLKSQRGRIHTEDTQHTAWLQTQRATRQAHGAAWLQHVLPCLCPMPGATLHPWRPVAMKSLEWNLLKQWNSLFTCSIIHMNIVQIIRRTRKASKKMDVSKLFLQYEDAPSVLFSAPPSAIIFHNSRS
jgi:hypothetical protein